MRGQITKVEMDTSNLGRLLRNNSTGPLYMFATAHNLFQGAELDKVLRSLVLKPGVEKVTIIDEGVYGQVSTKPEFDLQIEDMKFVIDRYVETGRARVVFGDNELLGAIESVAPNVFGRQMITMRSMHMLEVALTESAKDKSAPTLVVAGLVHIAQIAAVLQKESCEAFATNNIVDVMRKSEPDQLRYNLSVRGLAQMVDLAPKFLI